MLSYARNLCNKLENEVAENTVIARASALITVGSKGISGIGFGAGAVGTASVGAVIGKGPSNRKSL